ncbi:MAG: 4-hydroxythreonine-4-phosphate dehydrogenase PdxA [Spirochaetaceae bacterium]|nr:MAG: 4-hydroxythreonine-4-phosphate dehydrogenase PdxA [Spirochaetaceae bacterium]
MPSRPVRIGLTLGDPSGIGPELVAKVMHGREFPADVAIVVIGDATILESGMRAAGITFEVPIVSDPDAASFVPGQPVLLQFPTAGTGPIAVGEVSEAAGRSAFETLRFTVDLARSGRIDGFVYAPLNKQALHLGGCPYSSELEYFKSAFDCTDGENELNVLDGIWTTRVTSHIPLADVAAAITRESVLVTIRYIDDVLKKAGRARPRIAVTALNPHAGENGLFGREEIDVILPAIEDARTLGITADGPYPADTIFLRVRDGSYDGVVSMYHDQGQIAMKLIGFERGVTVAGGMPVPIATPAHGTAHDIAGRGIANTGAITEAIRVVCAMVAARAG